MKKNIVIIILSILVLGLGGYLVYDKVIDKEETNANNKNEEIVEQQDDKEIYATMARKYIDDVIDTGVYKVLDQLHENGLTQDIKTLIAISNVSGYESFCQDLFEIDVNTSSYFSENFGESACVSNQTLNSIFYDEVNAVYKKTFGALENAPKRYIPNIIPYEYSNKMDRYVLLHARSSVINYLYYYDVDNVEITDSKLEIKISYLTYSYTNWDAIDYAYYIGETLYRNKTEEEVIKAYNDNKKSLPKLTFNYEKEDGRYILKSVE